MKLDQELVRKILLEIEDIEEEPMGWFEIEIEGYSLATVSYHVELLAEAGFILAHNSSHSHEYRWDPIRLTYEGHSFIEVIREPRIWKETKAVAAKAGSMSLEMICEIGKAVVKNELAKLGLLVA